MNLKEKAPAFGAFSFGFKAYVSDVFTDTHENFIRTMMDKNDVPYDIKAKTRSSVFLFSRYLIS